MPPSAKGQPAPAIKGGAHGGRAGLPAWRRLWFGLVNTGFTLLYNRLAWAYNPVSWIASLGRWQRWQAAALHHLPVRGRILDLACGPGHLSADLASRAYGAVALDASPGMIRRAKRYLSGSGGGVSIVQGLANSLPFAPDTFDAIVVTFPTAFVFDPRVHDELWRVLRLGGRLIVVVQADFTSRSPIARLMEWLYHITGQRGPTPDLAKSLEAAGFSARRESVQVDGTEAALIVAEKPR